MRIHFNFVFYFYSFLFNDGHIMLINFLLAIVSKFSGSILTIVIVRLLSWSTSTWHYFARLCLVGLVHSLTCYFLLNNRSIHLGNVASNILAMAPAILLSIMPGNVVAFLRSVLFCLWLVLLLLESAAATELTVYASAQIIDNFIDKWADEHDVRQRFFFFFSFEKITFFKINCFWYLDEWNNFYYVLLLYVIWLDCQVFGLFLIHRVCSCWRVWFNFQHWFWRLLLRKHKQHHWQTQHYYHFITVCLKHHIFYRKYKKNSMYCDKRNGFNSRFDCAQISTINL